MNIRYSLLVHNIRFLYKLVRKEQKWDLSSKYLLYASPPIWKLHLHSDIASQPYKPTFYSGYLLITCLVAVVYSSWYSVFHDRDTSNWLSLSWQSYSCQCLNTKTSAQGNKSYTTKTLSIFYSRNSHIRLVVTQ